jgi:pilus assembly protein Flp/PilA
MSACAKSFRRLNFCQPDLNKTASVGPVLRPDRVLKLSPTETGIMKTIRNFIKNSKGATAIEYGLIAALIAVAAIAAMQGLGTQLKTTFTNVTSNMKAT